MRRPRYRQNPPRSRLPEDDIQRDVKIPGKHGRLQACHREVQWVGEFQPQPACGDEADAVASIANSADSQISAKAKKCVANVNESLNGSRR